MGFLELVFQVFLSYHVQLSVSLMVVSDTKALHLRFLDGNSFLKKFLSFHSFSNNLKTSSSSEILFIMPATYAVSP